MARGSSRNAVRPPSRRERSGTRKPLSREEIQRRIAELRTRYVPPRTSRENLERPLDRDIRVDETSGGVRLVLEAEGKDASWATIIPYQQRIGVSIVIMGGIAGVGTREDCRFRGYSRKVLENCLRWMRANGFQTSMLYGIPSYYPKFGYVKAFPEVIHTVAVRDAERANGGKVAFEPFQSADVRFVVDAFNADNSGRTGVTVRRPDTWHGFRKGLTWSSRAIVEIARSEAGRRVGYIVFDDRHLTACVIELAATTSAVYPALLRRAAAFAWEQRLEHIEFRLPEDHPFVLYCRTFGLRTQITCPRDGGPMIRLIDVRGVLESVLPELRARCANPEDLLPKPLLLQTNIGKAALVPDGGDWKVVPDLSGGVDRLIVRLPQWALAQMLYGYLSADALVAAGVLRGTRQAIKTLNALFPVMPHFHYITDAF